MNRFDDADEATQMLYLQMAYDDLYEEGLIPPSVANGDEEIWYYYKPVMDAAERMYRSENILYEEPKE